MAMAGLQYHGGVGFLRTMKGQAAHEFVEISAPILPALLSSVGGLYAYKPTSHTHNAAPAAPFAYAALYHFLANSIERAVPSPIL